MSVTVDLSTGMLQNLFDGHRYNKHTLRYERVESSNPKSTMTEINLSCYRCGKSFQQHIHTNNEAHIWGAYLYLAGKFDSPCDEPQKEFQRAVHEVFKKNRGAVADSELLEDMKTEIREKVGRPDADIRFV